MLRNGIVDAVQLDSDLAVGLDVGRAVLELVQRARQLQHGNGTQREPAGSPLLRQ